MLPMSIVDTERPTTTARFEVMGTSAEVIVVGGDPCLVSEARWRLEDLERLWSRFRDDSEVSALNRAGGRPVEVSPETVILVRRAIDAWRLTGGAFDASVLGDLVRAGYDRPYERLGERDHDGEAVSTAAGIHLGPAALDEITVDGCAVQLPADAGFDPGGIGKGLAADMVVEELTDAGALGVCVNLGGDLRATGEPPDGTAWTVALEHPWSPFAIARLGLVDGAIATSTTLGRRWTVDGETRHHLIDPHTGRPAETDLTLATVVARRGWVAEVLTKTVLLRGAARPFDLVEGTAAEALAVDDHGEVRATRGFASFVAGYEVPSSIWQGDPTPSAEPTEPSDPTAREDATDGN
jgi:thiamine biosynthesis lipoprotein